MYRHGDYSIKDIYADCIKYLLVTTVLMFCLFYEELSYALGFIWGGIACLVNFNLMVGSLKGMIEKSTHSKAFFNGLYFVRLCIVIGVLWCAIELESINLLTATMGLLALKTVILFDGFMKHFKRYGNSE